MAKIYNQKLAHCPRAALEKIHDRVEFGENAHAYAPRQFYVRDCGTFSTRTVLYFLHTGDAPRYVHPMCGDDACVNPAHMQGSDSQYRPQEIAPLAKLTLDAPLADAPSRTVQIPRHLLTRKQQDALIDAALRSAE